MTHTEDIAAAVSAGEPVLILSAPAESPTITRYIYEGSSAPRAIRAHLRTCRAGGCWARAVLAAGVCVETGESVALSVDSLALLQKGPLKSVTNSYT